VIVDYHMHLRAPDESLDARGTAITLASDAHVPDNVGRDLDRAVDHAREAGYATLTVFDLRQRRQEPLG
jgi:histidinol-phosphatase (PHP family)